MGSSVFRGSVALSVYEFFLYKNVEAEMNILRTLLIDTSFSY